MRNKHVSISSLSNITCSFFFSSFRYLSLSLSLSLLFAHDSFIFDCHIFGLAIKFQVIEKTKMKRSNKRNVMKLNKFGAYANIISIQCSVTRFPCHIHNDLYTKDRQMKCRRMRNIHSQNESEKNKFQSIIFSGGKAIHNLHQCLSMPSSIFGNLCDISIELHKALTSHIITHMIFDETNRIFVIYFRIFFLSVSLCFYRHVELVVCLQSVVVRFGCHFAYSCLFAKNHCHRIFPSQFRTYSFTNTLTHRAGANTVNK